VTDGQELADLRVVLATPHARHDAMEASLRRLGVDVLRIRTPAELTVQRLREHAPRYVFFPHWSWKIPRDVFEDFECVIFHMTDVPFGRGGSPLQNLIVRGLRDTRVTALRCVEEMDAGPVYLKRPLSLAGTAEEILRGAGEVTEQMIVEMLRTQPVPQPQEGEVVAFRRRQPADGDLLLAADLGQIYDFIRMLDADGYPRAFLEVGRWRQEFSSAQQAGAEVRARVRIVSRS
jgi:methionyl-tRNA formyltransferase